MSKMFIIILLILVILSISIKFNKKTWYKIMLGII